MTCKASLWRRLSRYFKNKQEITKKIAGGEGILGINISKCNYMEVWKSMACLTCTWESNSNILSQAEFKGTCHEKKCVCYSVFRFLSFIVRKYILHKIFHFNQPFLNVQFCDIYIQHLYCCAAITTVRLQIFSSSKTENLYSLNSNSSFSPLPETLKPTILLSVSESDYS